ncbi:unnamed protein product [Zymoseptoria tritici ST99CH_3D7]|uniref:Uncharacterized protein n=1 Tax=Zymoseptoria tritici (strain ST99CH_3D7) TaxID=1276538 RepID=A0A1X7SAA0_ZYMT9|nr:unnamed protein product [Zymoseptoria tritici ST99CH_3D7]
MLESEARLESEAMLESRARKDPLKPHFQDLAAIADWCKKFSLDRYHMPDATNLLRLIEKMRYVQGLQSQEEVHELAFRVGKILIQKYLGVKKGGDGRAATAKEVNVLAREVGELWKETTDMAEEENEEEDVEEVVHGGDAKAIDDGDSGDNDDDEDSLARLENAYATPTPQVRSNDHLRKATSAAGADEHKTPPAPVIAGKVETEPNNTSRPSKPGVFSSMVPLERLADIRLAPAPGRVSNATARPAQYLEAKRYTASLNELYERREALVKRIAARKIEGERLGAKLKSKREEMVLLVLNGGEC